MAFQPALHMAQVVLQWVSAQGHTWQNRLHFWNDGFTFTDMQALANVFSSTSIWFGADQYFGSGVTLTKVTVTDLRTEGASIVEQTLGLVGIGTAELLPPNAALLITVRTALRGRSYRGRIYVAGLTEGDWDGVTYSSAVIADIPGLFGNWSGAAALQGWLFMVLSRVHNGVPLNPALGQLVTSLTVRSGIPASQRRRANRP